MIIGKGAVLSIQDEHGNFVEVGNIADIKLPEVTDFDQAEEYSEKTVVLIGSGSSGKLQLTLALQKLGFSVVDSVNAMRAFEEAVVVDRPVFPIRIPKGYNEPLITDQIRERDHGWYNKFNKPNGKRNLKR